MHSIPALLLVLLFLVIGCMFSLGRTRLGTRIAGRVMSGTIQDPAQQIVAQRRGLMLGSAHFLVGAGLLLVNLVGPEQFAWSILILCIVASVGCLSIAARLNRQLVRP